MPNVRVLPLLCLALAPLCEAANPPGGDWSFAARGRYEYAQQQVLPDASQAYTLRTELRYASPRWHALGARFGLEAVTPLFGGHYNDSFNGRNERPPIADPEAREIDQAYLSWQPDARLDVRAGRQWLYHDTQRFIGGGPAWRQNNQSYDALSLRWTPLETFDVQAAQVWTIHRPVGRRSPAGREDADARLLHATLADPRWGRVMAYGYWLGFEPGDAFPASASTRTLGLALEGARSWDTLRLRVRVEGADQSPHADGGAGNRAHYALLRASLEGARLSAQAELERLGGDGDYGFATPLAALHAMNGWADRFTQTPGDGLRDLALGLGYRDGPWNARLSYHDFRADAGDYRYGGEWDAQLSRRLPLGATLTLKAADYRGRESAAVRTRSPAQALDLRRAWVQLEWLLPAH